MDLTVHDYIDSRICYKGGIKKEENKLIALHRKCCCYNCVIRYKYGQGMRNSATVTVENFQKLGEAKEFLKKWSCGKEKEQEKLIPQYFKF